MNIRLFFKRVWNVWVLLMMIIVLTIIMKVFLFASFKIPTPSMEPSIMAGDHILVNKLALGPRLYENFGFLKGKKTKMKRMKGMHKVKRNDVLVFDFPYKTSDKIRQGGNVFYVKRCVAIPRDTFYIDNCIYKVKGLNESLGNSTKQVELSKRNEEFFNEDILNIFPKDTTTFHWTIKNFGPLYVPGKGDNIKINSANVLLYKNIIEYETEKNISIKNDLVYFGDSVINEYTFQQDYYFMVGDLVHDSQDSRYWGLLPDDLVVGKATIVWKSQDIKTGKYRWDRFLKLVK